MSKVEIVSTRNESNEEVILERLMKGDFTKNDASDEDVTAGDGAMRYVISGTGQTVTRIGVGKYRVDETGETLLEP